MTDLAVFKAINAVQAALCKEGIAKDRRNAQQGYNFRGIDDIYNTLSGLLADNGLCILPEVLERTQVERITNKGGALFYTTVKVKYTIVSAVDGSQFITATYGEAMDSADKSTNKAMSAAYKYMCLQVFCIPTEGDNDADGTTPDLIKPQTPAPKPQPQKPELSIDERCNAFINFITTATMAQLNDERYKAKFNNLCKEAGADKAEQLNKAWQCRLAAITPLEGNNA
jgi:hypothetical protein